MCLFLDFRRKLAHRSLLPVEFSGEAFLYGYLEENYVACKSWSEERGWSRRDYLFLLEFLPTEVLLQGILSVQVCLRYSFFSVAKYSGEEAFLELTFSFDVKRCARSCLAFHSVSCQL